LSQARGLVGIGTDTPKTTLTVSGKVSAASHAAKKMLARTCVGATLISQGVYMSLFSYEDGVDLICKRGLGFGGFHFIQSQSRGSLVVHLHTGHLPGVWLCTNHLSKLWWKSSARAMYKVVILEKDIAPHRHTTTLDSSIAQQ